LAHFIEPTSEVAIERLSDWRSSGGWRYGVITTKNVCNTYWYREVLEQRSSND
jgi:hypothetical protein